MRGGGGESRFRSGEGEDPGGDEAQESYVPGVGLNPRVCVADSRVEQSPEVEGREGSLQKCFGGRGRVSAWRWRRKWPGEGEHGATAGGKGRRTTAGRCTGGGKLCRANPKSGSGMKQGQQVGAG